MKLKQRPDDFRVEELTDAVAGPEGEFALYRLDKTGWTTPDALAAVRRRWQIDPRRLSYGGLKDRHAVTTQHLTILRGPERNLAHERVTVTYLGRRAEPFTAADIRANRFTVVLRSMSVAAVPSAEAALREVAVAGVPNYFDDQRFGSVGESNEFGRGARGEPVGGSTPPEGTRGARGEPVGGSTPPEGTRGARGEPVGGSTPEGTRGARGEPVGGSTPEGTRGARGEPAEGSTPERATNSGVEPMEGSTPEFVAKEMVFGRFERALWLALAAPYEFDRADMKREKAVLVELWGRWAECQAKLPKGHARSLVSYLAAHPTDFKGAVVRLRPELQGLYLSAYQSYLWNKMLAAWLTNTLGPAHLTDVELKLGRVPAPVRVPDEHRAAWESLTLPLPSARVKPEPGAPWVPIVEDVLKTEGLTLAELKVKGMQKPFFSKGGRAACVRPENLTHANEADELNKGRRKLTLRFDLPRGSYATMLVKRVTLAN
ncbi:tRNA pseudouridine(13) synthase TruD [Frigoriglobus tundricola]|uniref:tRNA pseudouridine(13) synthase n=1 Tax=Frigoriglobus tundricola TaxID=2774151 RepID=A0A6M5YF15_9BACT|nr:tRNA pseudouridine(13) synthase TruD [Frigoriglobus tundricola]QJW92605.1 tRNA pseudouridine(13) synthase [Frigoriglobus tundricola]